MIAGRRCETQWLDRWANCIHTYITTTNRLLYQRRIALNGERYVYSMDESLIVFILTVFARDNIRDRGDCLTVMCTGYIQNPLAIRYANLSLSLRLRIQINRTWERSWDQHWPLAETPASPQS
jgi:hypothetical protein